MRATVVTTDLHGRDRVDLGTVGGITQLRWTISFPGGCLSASWQQYLDPAYQHRALSLSRLVEIWVGAALVWTGTLDEPKRDVPWQLTATGSAADAKNRVALTPPGADRNSTLNLAVSVQHAISRGLNWTVGSALTTPAGAKLSGTAMLDELLATVASNGVMWQLTPQRVLTTPALPAAPSLRIAAAAPPGARTMDGWATVVYGTFQDSTTKTVQTVSVSAAAAVLTRYGTVEKLEDLTVRGPITPTAASAALTNLLRTVLPRPGWTEPITCSRGQLFTMGGVVRDPLLIRPGVMAAVDVVDPDTRHEPGYEPTLIVGQVDVDADVEAVQITPLAGQPERWSRQTARTISALSTPTTAVQSARQVSFTVTTAADSTATITHGLGAVPSRVSVERTAPAGGTVIWTGESGFAKTSTQVTFRAFGFVSGTATGLASTSISGVLTVYP